MSFVESAVGSATSQARSRAASMIPPPPSPPPLSRTPSPPNGSSGGSASGGKMVHGDPDKVAVSVFFEVSIDGHDLGAFTACDGLGVEVTIEPREEGGLNGFIHQLAGRMKYTNVKLTRPLDGDSAKIATWLASMNGVIERTTARIVAKNHDARPVAEWVLMEVIPVRWQGPSLSVDSAKIATETLELAHHGFLDAS